METKLKRGIYLTFGITFALIVAMIVVWKLKFYDEVTAQITKVNGEYTTQAATAATLDDNLKAEAIAKEQLVLSKEQLEYFRQRFRALRFDLVNEGARNRTWIGYMNEYFADYGLEMRRQLVKAADETGVVLNTALKIDAPPQMPENVTPPPSGFLKPVTGGNITTDVTGSLPDILRFLERVNRSPILMTVGAIKLEGASPSIKATFTITPYLVASGPSIQLQAPASATPIDGDTAPQPVDAPQTPPAN
ncbi:MAG TPA: hypothetical protein VGB45_05700 [Abditibacterium sp.]|jgi:hypothetical protein